MHDETAASLHQLTVSTAALERLLNRRGVDGALVPADPALIQSALDALRAEVRRVEAMLEAAASEATDPERLPLATMIVVLAHLRGVVDGLERIVRVLAG